MVKKTRSPNYPRINLRDAIEQATQVYKEEGTHPASEEDIVKDLGYTTLNGTSRSVLSALKKYGLLQRNNGGFKISDDAVAIIELPPGDSEHAAAMRRSAFRPALFAELYEKYRMDLPNDTALRHFLITRGFNPKTTNEVIHIYRDTLEFMSKDLAAYAEIDDENQPKVELPLHPAREQPMQDVQTACPDPVNPNLISGLIANQQAAPTPATVLQFKTSETSEARIELIGDVTQDSIDMLVSILNVQKLVFPKENQPK